MGSRGTKGRSAAKPRGKRIGIRRAAKGARRNAPKGSSRKVGNDALARELADAREQQTATLEVLRVISGSPGELDPIFKVALENALRLCHAKFGNLFLYRDGKFYPTFLANAPPALAEHIRKNEWQGFVPSPGVGLDRILRKKALVHILDDRLEPNPGPACRFGGARSLVAVPMLKEDELVGAFVIYRQEVRAFTDREIELVQSFAAQVAIAIENARLLSELRQRTDDLAESLDQQTATSEVLRVISSSPGALEPVFKAMLENAIRICDAKIGIMWRFDGNLFHAAALVGAPPALTERVWGDGPFLPEPGTALDRVYRARQVFHCPDFATEGIVTPAAQLGGARSLIAVPMFKEREFAGAILIYRQEVQPFTDKQIELVQNFAAQAVIAIENTRLLNELRETLDRQTATSEVLEVISRSPGELEPVFTTVLDHATRICEAKFGTLFRYDGELVHRAANIGVPAELLEEQRQRGPFKPAAGSNFERALQTREVVHTADAREAATVGAAARYGGARSMIVVPMLKEDTVIGSINIYRQEVRPFTDKQIELVKNFAAQAVIAIENARLLNELRQRTDDLAESLEQQTATSEVLKIISSSPGALEPVFASMLENATRICRAAFGSMLFLEGDAFRRVAMHNAPPKFAEFNEGNPRLTWKGEKVLGRVVTTKQVVHVADVAMEDPETPICKFGGARTLLTVPMLKDNEVIGTFGIYRQEVSPFSDKQIELVKNFATQAVIAIENSRLLNELRESLAQQTATADVLKVISRSAFDLQAVVDTLVESAARLCRADRAAIRIARDGTYHHLANFGFSPDASEAMKRDVVTPTRRNIAGRAIIEGKPIHILDAQADPDEETASRARVSQVRTALGVPMLRERTPIGVLLLQRKIVQPFTDKQIELAETFADQAVIAIENVRLFDEIQDKSRQLAEASQHKLQFLANMSHELRTPLNAILGYTELIADGIYGDPPEKMQTVLKRVESNGKHLLGLINAVLDLSKIEAGQLTLDLADYSLGDVTQTVYSAVEALAIDKKLALKAEVASDLPRGRGDERRLAQVLLNLVGNAIKFTDAGEVVVTATAGNGSFNVSVRDSGSGISATDQAKLFQEFHQADNSLTRKKGGTGLGLAISKRIIEMHGGRIWVESVVGQGSTFAFTLPVRVEQQVKVE